MKPAHRLQFSHPFAKAARAGAGKEQGRPRPEWLLGARAPLLLGGATERAIHRSLRSFNHLGETLIV
jgi:hypothetical protein